MKTTRCLIGVAICCFAQAIAGPIPPQTLDRAKDAWSTFSTTYFKLNDGPAGQPPPPVKLSVGKPFDVLAHSLVGAPDTILSAVKKSNGEYQFWTGSRTPWEKYGSEGGALKATKLLANPPVKGYPCPEGYSNPCLLEHTAPTNVGMWPANVYQISDDEILVFIHLEFRWHGKWNIRHGLGYSTDGGDTFQWCGYIVAPDGPCGKGLTNNDNCPNMGLTNYIIKDGFFQLYYHDSLKPESPSKSGRAWWCIDLVLCL